MIRSVAALVLAITLSACNYTSQLDRDFGICFVMSKTSGAKCSVDIPPTPVATP